MIRIWFGLCFMEVVFCFLEFPEFKRMYHKSYVNNRDERLHEDSYKKNNLFIDEHNLLFNKGLSLYKMGHNIFADVDHEVFVRMTTGVKKEASKGLKQSGYSKSKEEPLPTLDWRKHGAVGPVINQGGCASCWAFAAVGALEGQIFIKDKKFIRLSPQNLIDCGNITGNQGCDAGSPKRAYQYMIERGVTLEKNYPYQEDTKTCRRNLKVVYEAKAIISIPKGDEVSLKNAVGKIGPVSVLIDASMVTFQLYESGIYDDPKCSKETLNHAVLLVGYGTDSKGVDYWIAKNSWGTEWGEKGFFKMIRGKNQCGLANSASFPAYD